MGWGGERRQSSAKKCNLLQYKGSSLGARLMAVPESSCTFTFPAAIFLGLNIVSVDDDLKLNKTVFESYRKSPNL